LSDNIRQRRRQMNLTQETLAEHMGVSVQAVSKWECGQSCPDIESLPELAAYLGVSADWLLAGAEHDEIPIPTEIPHDNVIRIMQFKGMRLLTKDTYQEGVTIPLKLEQDDRTVHMEIWGNADIKGNVSGGVNAGKGVNCGNINGDVNPGGGVNCGNVRGDVNSGGGVNCGNVTGEINAGGRINCGDIDGNIESCAGEVHCGAVKGDIKCAGNVIVKSE